MITGLVDAHATAMAVSTLVAGGKIGGTAGALAILLGLSANMAVKIPATFVLGPPPFAIRVAFGLALLLAGLWGGYALNSFILQA